MNALLFTGHSGAGKTTICRFVKEQLGAHHIVEREVSRSLACEQGFERSRLWVARIGLGQAVVAIRNRTIEMVSSLPEGDPVLVDGVYDRLLPMSLRQQVGARALHLIAITAPKELRIVRLSQRMSVDTATAEREMDTLDAFKQEVGGEELINQATLTIVNDGSIEQARQAMQTYLATHLAR